MSISSLCKTRSRPASPGGRPLRKQRSQSPVTVSKPALLVNGSDQRFRVMVYDLLTIATRMGAVREHLADRMELSGPQYSVLMAIAQYPAPGHATVGALARLLHVTSAFIATETGKLVRLGLITKRPNPNDGRSVLLQVTSEGTAMLEKNSDEIRRVNDKFFGALNRAQFEALAATAAMLVRQSAHVLPRLSAIAGEAASMREAAE